MKKLIYCALALAAGLLAASCQQENLEPAGQGDYTVTYTVEAPMDVQTKAIADGLNVDELIYEVWWTSADETRDLSKAQRLYQGRTTMIVRDGVNKGTVTLNLVKDQHYTILFWAQVEGTGVYNTENLVSVHYNSTDPEAYYANDEALAAFYAVDFVNDGVAKNSKVFLKRPFAQVNLATLNERDPKNNPIDYNITLVNSKMILKKVPTVFNVATSEATEDSDFEFEYNVVPSTAVAYTKAEGEKNIEYYYAGMNYVFAGSNLELTYRIQTRLNGSENLATIENIIPNVPVKENYRTNIVGNLLTSKTDYEVIVDANFNTNNNSGNIEVVGEGIVKNMNGDYEVTNARGLAYAINNLFVEGGNFYLTAAEYDMTGIEVEVPTINRGVTLNIYGETPVVTRSATASFAGVTIIGLDSIIDVISEGANVSISGVALTDDGSVLVETNKGTLVVSDATGEEAIVGSGAAIKAGEITDLATLNAALATGVKTIEIATDIEADEVVLINRSVVINGNNKTFTTTDTRAFRLIASDIEVTFNNLNIISSAVRVGTNDIRGVSIDGTSITTGATLENITLTLNDCSHDFTDPSANDWAYAVNVVGGKGYKVTVDGGVYEGANVINVRGTAQTVTVKNATLNSTYPYSDQHYGACIYVVQNQGSSVYAEGNTFNGDNAIAFNIGTGTALEEKDNTDNTMYYSKGVCYVKSAEKLQAAINNAKAGENTIAFSNDINGNVTVVQKPGVKITINGCDMKYNGFIKVHSNSNHYADAAVTIKNINFETSTPALNFIEALENGSERYSTNITAENCSFTATGAAVNTTVGLQIKASKNAKVLNCTATDMHSLIQAQSCDETVVVNGCTVKGKNGVAFKQVKAATVEDTKITALEYGIRFDGNTDNYGITVKDINVTAVQPLIVRKMTGADNTITLEGENTLTTDEIYQIVITKGSDDEEYVKPTGTYTLTGADDFVVYPSVNYGIKVSDGLYKEGVNYYVANAAGLVALSTTTIKADETVSLIADIDLTDINFNGLYGFNPENPNTFDGKGHTVSNWTNHSNASDFGFIKSWTGTIKNLTIDNASLKTSGRSAILAGKVYCNIENCHVVNSTIEDSYWACGLIAGHYNSGNVLNCSATNSTVKSNGGTGAIVGLLNETAGTRSFTNCTVTGCTVNNTGIYGESYSGALICGMINISNSTVKFVGCELTDNTKEGEYVGDLYYAADDDITIVIE